MIWALYGFLHSIFRAAFTEVNRLYGYDAWRIGFIQSVCGLIVSLCFLPWMTWPSDGQFYFGAVGVALIFSVGTLSLYTLSAQKSGRVSSIYMPLEALVAFIIWIAIMPSLLREHMDDMLMTSGAVLAFLMTSLALLRIRPNDVNLKTFSIVAPLGMTYAVAGVVTKLVLPYSDIWPLALPFVTVNFMVMTMVMGFAVLAKRKVDRVLFSKPVLKAGVITGVLSLLVYGSFVIGVANAPNPGYISFMAMLLPVWLTFWHRLTKQEDTSSPLACFIILLGVLMLVVSTL